MRSRCEYKIVHAPNPDVLVRRVNEAIAGGWDATGGLCVDTGVYLQAMIRWN